MNFDEALHAVRDARATLESADRIASSIAELLTGRLRKVHHYHLARLKRELADYDAKAKRWKS